MIIVLDQLIQELGAIGARILPKPYTSFQIIPVFRCLKLVKLVLEIVVKGLMPKLAILALVAEKDRDVDQDKQQRHDWRAAPIQSALSRDNQHGTSFLLK